MDEKQPVSRASAWKAYLERNWLLLLLIAVGIAGLATALALFLVPCPLVLVTSEVRRNVTVSIPTNISLLSVSPLASNVALDASGSIADFFVPVEKPAARVFVETLSTTLAAYAKLQNVTADSVGELSAGVSQWNNGIPVIEIPLTADEDAVAVRLTSTAAGQEITRLEGANGGTSLATGLVTCGQQLLGQSGILTSATKRLCLVFSDGISWDRANTFVAANVQPNNANYYVAECNAALNDQLCTFAPTREAGTMVYEYCQQLNIQTCTTFELANELNKRGVMIAGIYMGNDLTGQEVLHRVTNCEPLQPFDLVEAELCPFFAAADTETLSKEAENLAVALVATVNIESFQNQTIEQVTTEVVTTQTDLVCTTEPIYFFFLVMFIPLGLYLFWRPISLFFAKYCCPPAPVPLPAPALEEEQLFTAPPAPVAAFVPARVPSLAPTHSEEMMREPGDAVIAVVPDEPEVVVAPEPNTLVKSKRYRWSIKAADAYLWNLGASGVAPLNVNFNGVAPPSAPKKEATKKNMKRKTQRISLRWSYVAPPIEEGDEEEAAESRASSVRKSRVSTRVVSMAQNLVPQWEPPVPMEPFEEDEIQPGDIDYEYTMCLMRFCPCLRPTDPYANATYEKAAPPGQQRSSENSLSVGSAPNEQSQGRLDNHNFDSSYYSMSDERNRDTMTSEASRYDTMKSNTSKATSSTRPSMPNENSHNNSGNTIKSNSSGDSGSTMNTDVRPESMLSSATGAHRNSQYSRGSRVSQRPRRGNGRRATARRKPSPPTSLDDLDI